MTEATFSVHIMPDSHYDICQQGTMINPVYPIQDGGQCGGGFSFWKAGTEMEQINGG